MMKWCECLKREVENCDCPAATPAPVGGVEGLVKRARGEWNDWIRQPDNDSDPIHIEIKALIAWANKRPAGAFVLLAEALTSLSARLASETDRAETAIESLNEARDECATATARVEALEKALIYVRDSGLLSPLGTAFKTVCAALKAEAPNE
jgi:hypothetical protein